MKIDHTKLAMKITNDAPSRKALTEAKSFSTWRLLAYSNTRRGWPSNPTRNRGKNVRLKKMNIVQKCHFPSRWFIVLPVILGSQ